ncbi:MAG: IPT/TIG domain-containing protein [Bacteroidetes bacterium]|nr:IPT/TIG domain-containing protein [Bacteroidota bacterium]
MALILMSFLLLFGCINDEPFSEIVVIPEQVMQVGGDHVRLSGRIIANGSLKIADHGFEISLTEEFNTPLIISLGSKTKPGRFIGDTGDLKIKTTYFWRPFIQMGNDIRYGESSTFSTQNTSILDFNPKQGLEGTLITIEGSNFTENIQVIIDGRNAQITERVLDTKIKAMVPPLENNRFAKIELIVQDMEPALEFSTLYEYVIGIWEQLGQFITNKFYHKTLSMVVGNQLIFGLGLENFVHSNRLWTYDLDTDNWTPLEFPGTAVSNPFSAAPYFGGGNIVDVIRTGLFLNSNKFYKYEENQIVFLGFTPFKLTRSMAFVWDDKLYVFGGELENKTINKTIYQYDPASDVWTEIGEAPRRFVTGYPNFQYQDNLFFISSDGVLWRYKIESGLWEPISEFPSGIVINGISEVIGSKAYIGISKDNRSLTEYDILQNTWLKKVGFEGGLLEETGGSWVYNGKLYLLKNKRIINRKPMVMWSFSPDEF